MNCVTSPRPGVVPKFSNLEVFALNFCKNLCKSMAMMLTSIASQVCQNVLEVMR